MLDENNEIFKHDTVCTTHARMAKKVTQAQLTTTIRKSAIIKEYDSGKAAPNATILTATDLVNFSLKASRKENTKTEVPVH